MVVNLVSTSHFDLINNRNRLQIYQQKGPSIVGIKFLIYSVYTFKESKLAKLLYVT